MLFRITGQPAPEYARFLANMFHRVFEEGVFVPRPVLKLWQLEVLGISHVPISVTSPALSAIYVLVFCLFFLFRSLLS